MSVSIANNTLEIPLKNITLEGTLILPENVLGAIIYSHGSGSSKLSSRNNYIAQVLQKNGLGTLLFKLLTNKEDKSYETRFSIELLTQRRIEVTEWLQKDAPTKNLKRGYFGASTGAASALRAAAFFGDTIGAVVSRGGRPDLAMEVLTKVRAPTLLIKRMGPYGHKIK